MTWQLVGSDGAVLDLADLRPRVVPVANAGMPETKPVLTSEQEGGVYQGMLVSNRDLKLQLTLRRGSLHSTRAALIAALNPALLTEETPAYLRYVGATKTVQTPVVYRGGLETIQVGSFDLLLHSLDPYWTNTVQTTQSLTPWVELNPANYIVQRQSSGWVQLGSIGGAVYALLTAGSTLYAGGAFGVKSWDGTTWSTVGTVGDTVNALLFSTSGTLYAGGSFGVKSWDGTTWSSLGALTNVNALAFDKAGDLWAGDGTDAREWNGTSWVATSFGGAVYALFYDGSFMYAGGVGGIKRWLGAWSVPGSALGIWPAGTPVVYAIARGPDGLLYIGGEFNRVGTEPVYNVAKWTGQAWLPLGTGTASGLAIPTRALHWMGDELWAGGDFTVAGGQFTWYAARWTGSTWFLVDVNAGQPVRAIGSLQGQVILGYAATSSGNRAGVTTVNYAGDVPVAPVLTITGPGRPYACINEGTGQVFYFTNIILATGEVLTVDFGKRTIRSNRQVDSLLGRMVAGSNLATWRLVPGANQVSLYVENALATASLSYNERYYGLLE